MSGNDDHLFGLDGAETMDDDVETVAERAWDDDRDQPVIVQEFTARSMRSFARVDHMLDHLIEYQLEEQHDDAGRTSDHLYAKAKDPAVIAAFDAALDLLFDGMRWRWANDHVANWTVTWTDGAHPEFTYERVEL